MFAILSWVRHLLLVIPAIGTIWWGDIGSPAVYVAFTLMTLLVARVRLLQFQPFAFILFTAEVALCIYISLHYQGIMFLMLLSPLVALFEPSSPWKNLNHQIAGSLLLLIGYNLALVHQASMMVFVANVAFLLTALLLISIRITSVQKHEAESLYDQLSLSHMELSEARTRLVQYAKQVEQFAQLEERNRISKDIHDDLGHRLIRQKMMTEAILQIYKTKPDQAIAMLEQVRDQMSDSMETLRRTVRRIAPPIQDSQQYSLDHLIQSTRESFGIAMEHQVEGMPYALYPSIEYVLYRNAQEAVTNALRHGGATEVHILLRYDSDQILMRISNNGRVPDSEQLQKGIGLRGMEERVHLIGGQLQWSCTDQFSIMTILPHYPKERSLSEGAIL
ncbi:sensor histidine kinase [Paenibacillus guangzhouensis]|uniref:sensor histidine kinase n=1 Tax=Paenibacillus guangzhouensis TaxID=1473112 RepID=UPI00187B19B0|nr:sensor histidine kinase [Paenibacillus guangzhouensis]